MNAVLADDNHKSPIFYLEFNIYGTGAEIRLNDIPVYYHDTEGQISSQKPVPESIIDGENMLTVKSFPLEEYDYKYQQGAYVEAIISVREKGGGPNAGKIILQLKINPSEVENKLLGNTLVEYGDAEAQILVHSEDQTVAERRVTIKSPFPRWAWQDGQKIENTSENFNSLLKAYKVIWTALNDGDMEKIEMLYEAAADEYAKAYHYQDRKQGHRIMSTGGLVGDNDWGLGSLKMRLEKRKYYINIFAGGRIAKLVDIKGNESLITYLNKNVKIVNFQKFGFYKNKAGEWVMIR